MNDYRLRGESGVNDYMVRLVAKEAGVRGLLCVTTGLTHEAQRRHTASLPAAFALGHGLTAAVLMGALLKVQQRVALKFEGDGPLEKMVVEADNYGRVRGYVVVPDLHLEPGLDAEDLANSVGLQGLLTVVKDLRLKDLYESVVPLHSGEIDTNLIYYLTQSEQSPSFVEIGVKVAEGEQIAAAGGLLLQLLPQADPTTLTDLVERLQDLPPLENLLADGYAPEKVLAILFTGIPYDILETYPLRFECLCSWERSEQALRLLGRVELDALVEEGQAIIDCHFCHERYVFGREALEMIRDES